MMKTSLVKHDYFVLPQPLIARPSVVIGKGGSGKTVTLLRLAYLCAKVYGYDIIFIDAKGDETLAVQFVAAMRQAGKMRIKAFPYSPYYGWVGDARTLYNRLMAVQTFSEPYYELITTMMLDLAVKAPGGPPRSSEELLTRLKLEQLNILYRGLPGQDDLARIKPDHANGVYNRYRAFFQALDGKLDQGFTFDETDAAYVLLDTLAFQRETSSIGRYLVEDIAHYITKRKPKDKKVLIVIDEVSALDISAIANLSERLRSFGAALMLSSQSEEGLAKSLDERTRILKTSHMLILHTSNAPERLIERAGKQARVSAGWSVRDQAATGHGTMQLKEDYIVPPDEVRRLDTGECFVIAQGAGYKARVVPVTIDQASQAAAQHYLATEQVRTANAAQQTINVQASTIQMTQQRDDDESQGGLDSTHFL